MNRLYIVHSFINKNYETKPLVDKIRTSCLL